MGGLNSGPHRSARLREDRARKFDVIAMAREAAPTTLRDGARWHLSYSRGDGLSPITAIAELVEYRPRFGGRRWLFACPRCPRRARVLYGGRPSTNSPQRIACRQCQGIRYASQFESPERHYRRQLAKIEARLGGDPRKLEPPKRRKTWDRLAARHQVYRDKIISRRRDVLRGAMRGKLWPVDPQETRALNERYGVASATT